MRVTAPPESCSRAAFLSWEVLRSDRETSALRSASDSSTGVSARLAWAAAIVAAAVSAGALSFMATPPVTAIPVAATATPE